MPVPFNDFSVIGYWKIVTLIIISFIRFLSVGLFDTPEYSKVFLIDSGFSIKFNNPINLNQ